MTLLTQRALRVFSVLEAYRGANDDIVDALLPFFEPMLHDLTGKVYNPPEFAAKVQEAYRWNFTADIAEELVSRFARRGWLTQIGATRQEHAYQVTYSRPADDEASTDSMAISQTVSKIVDEFSQFIKEISPLSGYNRTPDELSNILVEWIVSIDAYNEDILRQKVKTIEIQSTGTIGVIESQPEESSGLSNDDRYLCARFVKKLYVANSPWIPDLCRIASVGLLTEVVQDFNKPTSGVKRSDLAIYLDAPVAMDALGLSGKSASENIQPILADLVRIGCQVRIFRASVAEFQRVLRVMLSLHPADRTGATANAIRRGEVLERYATSVRDNPDPYLNKYGIAVVDQNLSQFPNSHDYFSIEMNRALFGAIHWHLDPNPRGHDADVLTFVMRRRGSSRSADIFHSKHLFITKNGFLSQLARKFCREQNLILGNQVPPAIHQRQLATMTWLRTGLGASEEVPKRYLLAACERVLELKRGMVEKARQAVSHLSAEQRQQLELMFTEDRSVQMMMDKTLGSSAVIDDGNMPKLLEAMKQSLVTDIKKEARKESAAVRRNAKAKIDAAEEARLSAESERTNLQKQLISSSADDVRLVESVASAANRRVRRFRWFLNIGVSLVLLGIFALPLAAEFLASTLKYMLLIIGGLISTILAYYQLWDRKTGLGRLVERYGKWTLASLASELALESKVAQHPLVFDSGRFIVAPEPGTESDRLPF